MGSKREVGGVVLAFGGFVFLVMSVKGTWGDVWAALTGNPTGGGKSVANPTGSLFPGAVPGSGNSKGQYAPNDPNGGTVDKNGRPVDPVTGAPAVAVSYLTPLGQPAIVSSVPYALTAPGGGGAQTAPLV